VKIDWFTVAAQALNFLILVWLMKRFLYKPVLDAIDQREKAVAAAVADAEAKKAEAAKDRDLFKRKNDDFDAQRTALLSKAAADAAAEAQRLKGEAHKSADALAAKFKETMLAHARALDQAVGLKLRQEVFAIARKALADLAGAGLEERMVAVFLDRLRGLDDKAKGMLGQALKAGPAPALLRSAVGLAPEQRATIQKALNEAFSADIHLNIETAPELGGGIELLANGQRLAWTVGDYIGSLESDVSRLFERTKPNAKPEPEAKPEGTSVAKDAPAPAGQS
jgi:F-type H+-transporting ATPase subunit b